MGEVTYSPQPHLVYFAYLLTIDNSQVAGSPDLSGQAISKFYSFPKVTSHMDRMIREIIKKCLPTYETTEKLGEGTNGTVYRIKDSLKERAVKVVPILVERSLSCKTSTELELKVSRDFNGVRDYYDKIKGKGVIEVYDFHLVDKKISKRQARAYLVILMELCPENLLDHVVDNHPLSPDKARELMLSLAGVLKRLSFSMEDAFLVTDLKPSNLLFNNSGNLVIGDLGALKRISSVSTKANAQFTLNWSAPEFILNGPRPGVSAAVYSYGLVSYFIWEGHLPYENKDFTERIVLIRENGIRFNRADVPGDVKHLIRHCTEFDPENRPKDFGEILESVEGSRAHLDSDSESRQTGTIIEMTGPKPGEIWQEPMTGIVFVWVPGGSFMMGCLEGDNEGDKNEKPAREVHVEGFWIAKYTVTQNQWKMVMNSNPAHFRKGPDYPVEQVSWRDAIDFIRRLSAICKRKYTFGLPTETQWEFAARSGGKPEKFAGENDLDAVAWYKANSNFSTHPVGKKTPNGLGIYDMSGNVLEWCVDFYLERPHESYQRSKPVSSDAGLNRVGRGGSWSLDARRCRTSARRGFPTGLRYSNLGFRLVRTQ